MTNPNDPWSNPYGQPGQPVDQGQSQYTQPQPPGYGPPPSGQPGYAQPQPGYAQPQYGQYGAPMPPAQFGPADARSGRPGTATAASVLSYIQAGFLIIAGIVLFSGAGLSSDVGNASGVDTGSATSLLGFLGVLDLALSAGLITGAVMLTSGRTRMILALTCAANLAVSLYYLTRDSNTLKGMVLVYDVLPVIALGLMFGGAVTRWLQAAPARR